MLSPASKTSIMSVMPASKAMKPSKRNNIEESPGKQDADAVQPTVEYDLDGYTVTSLHQEIDTCGSPTRSSRESSEKVQPTTPESNPCGREINNLNSEELPTLSSDTPEESDGHVEALALSSDPSQMPPRAAAAAEDRELIWARPGLGLSDPFVQTDNMTATLV